LLLFMLDIVRALRLRSSRNRNDENSPPKPILHLAAGAPCRPGVGTMKKRTMQAVACAISVNAAIAGASSAQIALSPSRPLPRQTNLEWTKDATVLVIAPDGTWGTATAPSHGRALANAIANCKSKYRQEIGCGYRSVSVRAGWSLAIRCGRENIIVAAKTLLAVEQAAVDSELKLRRDYQPDMPPCVRVVLVDPDGSIIAPDVAHLLRFVVDRRR
jgi:hypothetical protein